MNYDQPEFQNREARLQMELSSWIYQSHLWKKDDIANGYLICEWCGHRIYPGTAIADQLCPDNPKIREMRLFWTKTIIKGIKEAEIVISKSRTSSPSAETFMSGGIGYGTKIEKKKQG